MARWTMTAATAESTPPLNAQMARPLPTCLRIDSTVSAMKAAPLHSGCAWQISKTKLAKDFGAAIRMAHFRMELDSVQFPRRVFGGGHGTARFSGHMKARGQCAHMIAVAVPDAELFR